MFNESDNISHVRRAKNNPRRTRNVELHEPDLHTDARSPTTCTSLFTGSAKNEERKVNHLHKALRTVPDSLGD